MKRDSAIARLMTAAVAGVVVSMLAVSLHAQQGGAAGGAAGGAPAAGAATAKREDPALLLKTPSGPLAEGPSPAAAGGRGGAGNVEASVATRAVRSPEVSADHKITFRFSAPNAKKVQVQGDFTIHMNTVIDMTNDGNGVWSFTTEALKPSTYQYWFIVDGQNTPDPTNTYVRPASGVYKSMVDMPGPGMEFMAFRDVPHGAITELTYINRDNGTQRKVEVYTPPGYSKSTQSYPVIYLLHGANDYERGWTQSGRANLIMDNAIADGKAVPAIIVMPFGHPVTGSLGKQAEIAAVQTSLGVTPSAGGGAIPGASVGGGGGGGGRGAGRGGAGGAPGGGGGAAPAGGAGGAGPGAAAPTAASAEVPVAAPAAPPAAGAPAAAGGRGARGGAGGRGGRGGAGGGAPGGRGGAGGGGGFNFEKDLLTLVVPMIESEYRVIKDPNHRAIIGYSMGGGQASSIGLGHPELFSYVGMYSGGGGGANLAGIADPAKANQTYKWIWIGVGGDDTTALNGSRSADTQLTQRGVNHYYVELPGYHHDYQVWRLFLAANLPVLFRD